VSKQKKNNRHPIDHT
jgi:cell division septation protein DedD